jgi:large-conductance mechanosensitive channel
MNAEIESKSYIKSTVLITALAAISSELLSSLSTHILIPLIDSDCDKDGKPDIGHNLKNKTSKVGNKIIYSGEFIYTIIKFILILLFLFLIKKLV